MQELRALRDEARKLALELDSVTDPKEAAEIIKRLKLIRARVLVLVQQLENIEPGETEEQTINRESAEEAGLYDLRVMPRFREVQHYFYKFNEELIRKDAVYFIAKTESWTVKISHEHETYKWCTYEEALQLMKLRANRELLTKAHVFITEYYRQHDMF